MVAALSRLAGGVVGVCVSVHARRRFQAFAHFIQSSEGAGCGCDELDEQDCAW